MLRPPRPKKQQPSIGKEPINISNNKFWSTPSLLSSPFSCLFRRDKDIDIGERVDLVLKKGRKRKSQFSPKKGKEKQEPKVRVKKSMPKPTTARASIPSSLLSLEQHL